MAHRSTKNIESYEDLRNFCMSQLGEPVINIEVTPEQIENCIHDALEYYHDYHRDGSELIHLAKQITADDLNPARKTLNAHTSLEVERGGNIQFELDDSIVSVVRVLKFGNLGNYSSFFRQALIQDLYTNSVRIGDVTSYYLLRLRLADWNEFFSNEPEVKFRRHQNFVTLDYGFTPRIGDWVVIECYRKVLPYYPPESIELVSGSYRGFTSLGKLKFEVDSIDTTIPIDNFRIDNMIDYRDDYLGEFDAVNEDSDGNIIDIPEKGQFRISIDDNNIYSIKVGNHASFDGVEVGESLRLERSNGTHVIVLINRKTTSTSTTTFFGNVIEGADVSVPFEEDNIEIYLQDDVRDGFHIRIDNQNLEEFHEIYGDYNITPSLNERIWSNDVVFVDDNSSAGLFIKKDDTFYVMTASGDQIHYSTNRGKTWNDRAHNLGGVIAGFAIDSRGYWYSVASNHLHVSINEGSDWSNAIDLRHSGSDLRLVSGITMDEENNLWITTSEDGIYVYHDVGSISDLAFLGSSRTAMRHIEFKDGLTNVEAITFDLDGNILVADTDLNQIHIYDLDNDEWLDDYYDFPSGATGATTVGLGVDSDSNWHLAAGTTIYTYHFPVDNFLSFKDAFANKEEDGIFEFHLRIFPNNVDVENFLAHRFDEDTTKIALTIDYDLLVDLGIGWNRNIERIIFPDGDEYGYRNVWNDRFLREYCTQLIKRQWGINTKKYGDMQLPGGITFNGAQAFDEANTRINEMREQMLTLHSAPIRGFYG